MWTAQIRPFLDYRFYHNDATAWLIAAGIALAVSALLWVTRNLLARHLAKLTRRIPSRWDDILAKVVPKTLTLFVLAVGLFAGSLWLELPAGVRETITDVIILALLVQTGFWGGGVVRGSVSHLRKRRLERDPASVTTLNALGLAVTAGIWVTVALLALANAGVKITPLLAGLGVGGIAVALAVQTVFKDVLASLSIMLDKPFVVGDFLILDDLLGSVEHIGLRTTRLRSLHGEQLVFSNDDLLTSRLRNFGRMEERRVAFQIGVTYQTPRHKLARIPQITREAVEAQELTRFDRSHFKEFGAFSLDFEIVYYIGSPDYNRYMDTQQAINLHIHEAFEREEIEFAYPTQSLFIESGRDPSPDSAVVRP